MHNILSLFVVCSGFAYDDRMLVVVRCIQAVGYLVQVPVKLPPQQDGGGSAVCQSVLCPQGSGHCNEALDLGAWALGAGVSGPLATPGSYWRVTFQVPGGSLRRRSHSAGWRREIGRYLRYEAPLPNHACHPIRHARPESGGSLCGGVGSWALLRGLGLPAH